MKVAFYIFTIPIRILVTISWIVLTSLVIIFTFIVNELDTGWEMTNKLFESIWKY